MCSQSLNRARCFCLIRVRLQGIRRVKERKGGYLVSCTTECIQLNCLPRLTHPLCAGGLPYRRGWQEDHVSDGIKPSTAHSIPLINYWPYAMKGWSPLLLLYADWWMWCHVVFFHLRKVTPFVQGAQTHTHIFQIDKCKQGRDSSLRRNIYWGLMRSWDKFKDRMGPDKSLCAWVYTMAGNCQGPSDTILSWYLGANTIWIAILTILYVLRFDTGIYIVSAERLTNLFYFLVLLNN
jgi:hypothetical protein